MTIADMDFKTPSQITKAMSDEILKGNMVYG
jgi:bifunctional pyridoxal-dependent enzyme with beta-cystathionase and maltose regulon repressor activities